MSTQGKSLVDRIDPKPKKPQIDRQAISLRRDTFIKIRELTNTLSKDSGQVITADDVVNLLYDFYLEQRASNKK